MIMYRLFKPFVRPIARRKLDRLYAEKAKINAAIMRARKQKGRVSDLHQLAKMINKECHKWERWAD